MSKPKSSPLPDTEKLVKEQKTLACGCHITVFADDSQQVNPCPPCGFIAAAQHLAQAGQALQATAHRLRIEHNQATVAKAARSITKEP